MALYAYNLNGFASCLKRGYGTSINFHIIKTASNKASFKFSFFQTS